MRKLILGLAVSLDGYIEDANGAFDWCFTDQDYGLSDFYKQIDATFMGRKSYELVQSMGGVPDMPKMTNYVFSKTLQQVAAGDVLVSGELRSEVQQIKASAGKDIWLFGGASLTQALMDAGLVDVFWLSIHPIILGGGKPVFPQREYRTRLELLESKAYDTGLVSVKYALAAES